MLKRIIASLLSVLLLLACLSACGGGRREDGTERGTLDEIERFEGATSLQAWLDGALTEAAGNGAEWYALSLIKREPTLDYANYEAALRGALTGDGITSPVTKMKCALVLACLGSSPELVRETLDGGIGKLGLMSWVFGLHLLNAGYTAESLTAEDAVETILSARKSDGGWAITGSVSDVDVTAMTLQALAPNREIPGVAEAIENALALLASRQLESGGFKSYGLENAESSAQVLIALACLGVDAAEAGFQGGYDRILEGILQFATGSGGFSHEIGGDANELATSQVYLALSAALASRDGKTSVYLPGVAPGSFSSGK